MRYLIVIIFGSIASSVNYLRLICVCLDQSSYQTRAETELQRATLEVERTSQSLEEKIDRFENQRVIDIKVYQFLFSFLIKACFDLPHYEF